MVLVAVRGDRQVNDHAPKNAKTEVCLKMHGLARREGAMHPAGGGVQKRQGAGPGRPTRSLEDAECEGRTAGRKKTRPGSACPVTGLKSSIPLDTCFRKVLLEVTGKEQRQGNWLGSH